MSERRRSRRAAAAVVGLAIRTDAAADVGTYWSAILGRGPEQPEPLAHGPGGPGAERLDELLAIALRDARIAPLSTADVRSRLLWVGRGCRPGALGSALPRAPEIVALEDFGPAAIGRAVDAARRDLENDRVDLVLLAETSRGQGVALVLARDEDPALRARTPYALLGAVAPSRLLPRSASPLLLDSLGDPAAEAPGVAGRERPPLIAAGPLAVLGSASPPALRLEPLARLVLALAHRILPPTVGRRQGPADVRPGGIGLMSHRPLPWVGPEGSPRTAAIATSTAEGRWLTLREPGHRREAQRVEGGLPAASEAILLSAEDLTGLLAAVRALAGRLESSAGPSLSAIAFELGRHPLRRHRLAVVASDRADLGAKLQQAHKRLEERRPGRLRIPNGIYYGRGDKTGKTAFLFPGQGSQYPGMLRELCLRIPSVREWLDCLDGAYVRAGQEPPSRAIFHDSLGHEPGERRRLEERLYDMESGAQIGLVSDLALFGLIEELGIQTDCAAGHSNGEHAALLAAGIFEPIDRTDLCEQICRVGITGGGLPEPPEPEATVSVSSFPVEALERLVERRPEELFLAVDNCPSQVVLAGTRAAVEAATREIAAGGGVCSPLPFARAYHTPLFAGWTDLLREHYDSLRVGRGRIPVYSCVTAKPFPHDPAGVCDLASRQWSAPVRFRATIEALYEHGVRTFVEIGPDNKLSSFVTDTLRRRTHLAVGINSHLRHDLAQLHHLVAELYAGGVAMRPERLDRLRVDCVRGERPARQPRLPTPAPATAASSARSSAALAMHLALMDEARESIARVGRLLSHGPPAAVRPERPPGPAFRRAREPVDSGRPLLGTDLELLPNRLTAARRLRLDHHPLLADHAVGQRKGQSRRALAIVPFTVSLELAAEAAQRLAGGRVVGLADIRAHRWLALDRGHLDLTVLAEALPPDPAAGRAVRVRLMERRAAGEPAFEATVRLAAEYPVPPPPRPRSATAERAPDDWDRGRFYSDYAFHGPAFQGLERVLALGPEGIEADLRTRPLPGIEVRDLHLDPALLDCAGQLVAFWLLEHGERNFGIFPYRARELSLYRAPLAVGTPVRTVGEIRATPGLRTEASFDLMDAAGVPVARLEGLEQRWIDFPPRLAARFFGRDPREVGLARSDDPADEPRLFALDLADWPLLARDDLWARALAHQTLADSELAEWLDGTPEERRLEWLFGRLTAKEAVVAWALERGQRLSPAEVIPAGEPGRVARPIGPRSAEPLPAVWRLQADTLSLAAAVSPGTLLGFSRHPAASTAAPEAERQAALRARAVAVARRTVGRALNAAGTALQIAEVTTGGCRLTDAESGAQFEVSFRAHEKGTLIVARRAPSDVTRQAGAGKIAEGKIAEGD